MNSINIKGKQYIMVNERIKEFRNKYPNYSLTSEIVSLDNDSCIIKAVVIDENGIVRATGLAQEDRTSSMINKTSYIENCETSAWGRALGCFGIGIDTSIASAEEVAMAIDKQEKIAEIKEPLKCKCEKCGIKITEKVAQYAKLKYKKELCYKCQKLEDTKEIEV